MEKPASEQFVKVYLTLQKMKNSINHTQDNLEYILNSKKRVVFELDVLKEYIEQVQKITEDCK